MSDNIEFMEYKLVTSTCLYPQVEELKTKVKVLDTYVNLQWLLDKFKTKIRNNSMTNRWEIDIPGQFIYKRDSDNSAINVVDHLATLNMMPTKKIGQHIKTIAERNSYHPIYDSILSKEWDGTPRLDDFIATLIVANPELAKKIIKTWMCSAVAAIFMESGFVSHGVLVLQGPQGVGKTGWIKQLDPIGCGAVKEGAILDPSNKDDIISALSHWIVELGELDSTFKKDIARIKSFITSAMDQVRSPYAHKSTFYQRQTVFAASVNSETYLVDETGNRRWWTVQLIGKVRFGHGLDMQQVWAEVYHIWKNGHPIQLESEVQEQVNENNRQFEKVDPIKERLMTHYDWSSIHTREMTATQVMEEMGLKNFGRPEATHCGKFIRELTGGKGRAIKGLWRHPIPPFNPRSC